MLPGTLPLPCVRYQLPFSVRVGCLHTLLRCHA